MTTLSARDEYSVAIAAGEKLTITSSVSSTGYVDRWRGSTNLGRTVITASQTLVFGPYLFGMRFNVVCQTGSISFSSADENSAINDAEFIEFTQDSPLAQSIPLADDLGLFTHPFRFGAVGDGVTDDTTAVRAAIDYAQTIGANVDLLGKTYGITSQLLIDGAHGIYLHDGRLKVIGGTWATGTSGAVIRARNPDAGTRRHRFERVDIDCNSIGKTSWLFHESGINTVAFACTAINYLETGFWIKSFAGNGQNDSKFISCYAFEVEFDDEPKASTYSERTATGFLVDKAADVSFIDCHSAMNKYNLRCTGGYWNSMFTGCKFWSGPTRTDTNCINVLIDADVHRMQFSNCRFDDGAVVLYSFEHNFEGCRFIQFDYGMLRLIATAIGETANKLIFIGNTLDSSIPNAVLSAEGAGTWGTATPEWIGNKVDNATGDPFTIQSKSLITKGLSVNGNDVDLTSGNLKVAGTKVLGAQETGWTASTGTPNKAAYATYAGQTVSAGYVQAEAQATDNAVKANSERIKAIEDAMRTHGLIN